MKWKELNLVRGTVRLFESNPHRCHILINIQLHLLYFFPPLKIKSDPKFQLFPPKTMMKSNYLNSSLRRTTKQIKLKKKLFPDSSSSSKKPEIKIMDLKKTDEIISNSIESELISSNETEIFSEIEDSPASTITVAFTAPESVKQSQNVHSDDSSEFFNITTLNAKMIVDYLRCKKNLDAVMNILIDDCYGEFEGSNRYTELESKKVRIGYFCLFLWIVLVSTVFFYKVSAACYSLKPYPT